MPTERDMDSYFSIRGMTVWSALRLLPRLAIAGAIAWFFRDDLTIVFIAFSVVTVLIVVDLFMYASVWNTHKRFQTEFGDRYQASVRRKVAEHGLAALIARNWVDFELEFNRADKQ